MSFVYCVKHLSIATLYFRMIFLDFWQLKHFKGATKLYFTNYACVVIIVFDTSLYKSDADAFGKLAFCFSTLLALCRIELHNHCLCKYQQGCFGIRYSVFFFSLISKKRYGVINIWVQLIKENMPPGSFLKLRLKNSIYIGK